MSIYKIDKKKIRLSIEEENKLELPREMFTLIKVLDVIEKLNISDKLEEDKYKELVKKQLEKYEKLKKVMKNFNLDKFIEEYDLQQCGLAQAVLKEGLKDVSERDKLMRNITSGFIQMIDLIYFNSKKPAVSQFKQNFNQLLTMMKEWKKYMNEATWQSWSKPLFEFSNDIMEKKDILDVLSPEELNKIEVLLQDAQTKYNQF